MIVVTTIVLLAALAAARAVRARRRRCLNEALHEIRRPLQELALRSAGGGAAGGGSAWIDQASRALRDLDSLINDGKRTAIAHERFSVDELLGSCRERWAGGRTVRFEVADPDAPMLGDRRGIGAALDNLIANAVEHGRGPVLVRSSRANGSLTLSVSNAARLRAPRRARRDPKRGCGLRIAKRIAVEQGGRLEPKLLRGNFMIAKLVLPVATPAERAGSS